MNEPRLSSRAAYAAAVLFVVGLARFFFIPRLGLPADSVLVAELNGGLLPVAAHLVLLPVVAALPAPPWARAAGYGWLVIDITTDIMVLQGVADTVYLRGRAQDSLRTSASQRYTERIPQRGKRGSRARYGSGDLDWAPDHVRYLSTVPPLWTAFQVPFSSSGGAQ